ncbi:MAG: hypothetical protein IM574_14105 [Cytophagales bacterium]|jgi:hypothetical protein|nr:hypothetical protein [Cytophagales bacterium]MCA6388630.1 hypothetical protein [Cytophagales bacterium]MCA6393394.1 hypothetical protein [Cytophagales bacterium]MCA6394944.1 hypothetical protein [Cytophagales bacterium]MCA6400355.1 hypothetical protein [Cytophagales bacterium]
MNRLFVIFLLVLWGCSQESAVDSAKSSTFIRYFNGSFEDEAQALLETADKGLIILANTNFDGFNRVNLIKTDEFGNLLWQKFYPETDSTNTSYSGYGISLTPSGGYVIVGEKIQGTTTKLPAKLLIITTDAEGNTPVIKTMDNLSTRKGISVAVNPAENFLIVSSISSQPSLNIVLSEFSKTSLNPIWSRTYGAGALTENSLPNKLFVDAQDMAYWGGTVLKTNQKSSMRFIKTPPNSPNVLFDLTLGKPTDAEFSGDMIRYGNNFAFIGTSQTGTDSTSITVRRVTESGIQIFSRGYSIKQEASKELLTGEIQGNSLAVAQDGGLVLLGTVGIGPPGTVSTNTNYCLIKIDGFGNATPVWTKIIGGRFNDRGKAIITTSDGGHVILGTTTLANVKSLLLMKVDKDGNIPGL